MHNVQPYDRLSAANMRSRRCAEHNEDTKLWCVSDKKLVCAMCAVVGSHANHECITLEKAVDDLGPELGKFVERARHVRDAMDRTSRKLEDLERIVITNSKHRQIEIREKVSRIIDILQNKVSTFIEALRADESDRVMRVKDRRSRVISLLDRAHSVLSKSEHLESIRAKADLSKHASTDTPDSQAKDPPEELFTYLKVVQDCWSLFYDAASRAVEGGPQISTEYPVSFQADDLIPLIEGITNGRDPQRFSRKEAPEYSRHESPHSRSGYETDRLPSPRPFKPYSSQSPPRHRTPPRSHHGELYHQSYPYPSRLSPESPPPPPPHNSRYRAYDDSHSPTTHMGDSSPYTEFSQRRSLASHMPHSASSSLDASYGFDAAYPSGTSLMQSPHVPPSPGALAGLPPPPLLKRTSRTLLPAPANMRPTEPNYTAKALLGDEMVAVAVPQVVMDPRTALQKKLSFTERKIKQAPLPPSQAIISPATLKPMSNEIKESIDAVCLEWTKLQMRDPMDKDIKYLAIETSERHGVSISDARACIISYFDRHGEKRAPRIIGKEQKRQRSDPDAFILFREPPVPRKKKALSNSVTQNNSSGTAVQEKASSDATTMISKAADKAKDQAPRKRRRKIANDSSPADSPALNTLASQALQTKTLLNAMASYGVQQQELERTQPSLPLGQIFSSSESHPAMPVDSPRQDATRGSPLETLTVQENNSDQHSPPPNELTIDDQHE